MTDKFEQFLSDTYKSLISEEGSVLKQSAAETKVVSNIGQSHNDASMMSRAMNDSNVKKAGKAKKARDKAIKARLPKMTREYEDDTAAIVDSSK